MQPVVPNVIKNILFVYSILINRYKIPIRKLPLLMKYHKEVELMFVILSSLKIPYKYVSKAQKKKWNEKMFNITLTIFYCENVDL